MFEYRNIFEIGRDFNASTGCPLFSQILDSNFSLTHQQLLKLILSPVSTVVMWWYIVWPIKCLWLLFYIKKIVPNLPWKFGSCYLQMSRHSMYTWIVFLLAASSYILNTEIKVLVHWDIEEAVDQHQHKVNSAKENHVPKWVIKWSVCVDSWRLGQPICCRGSDNTWQD
jgi:hypothetical protein